MAKQKTIAPNKDNIETESDMRKRLKEGVVKDATLVERLIDPALLPPQFQLKTAPLEDEETTSLIEEIKEIKLLIFCRLILRHTSLFAKALCAPSIGEFLNNTSITKSDLRALCLAAEHPDYRIIRDACTDFTCANKLDEGETTKPQIEKTLEGVSEDKS